MRNCFGRETARSFIYHCTATKNKASNRGNEQRATHRHFKCYRGKRNDAEKVAVLKESVKDKGITIEQLITLLNQFLTDDAKLECAQYAFPYTTDYKTFLRIMDLFSQESYKWKLEEFYGKNKK